MKSRLRLLFALRGLLVALIGVGLLAGAAPGRAASAPGIVLAMRAGFDGYYKDGGWMPVRISVANDGPDARGTLRILAPRNDGNEVVFTRAVELPTQSRREIFMYIPAEGFVNNLDVTLNDGRNLLAKTNARLTQAGASDLVYGVLASSPSSFSGVLGNIDPLNGSAFVAQLEASDLPPAGQAWQGLDSLVVSDVDTGALSPEQRASLKEWVTNGGQLIVMGGPSWQKTAAGLSDLLPVLPSSTQNLADLEALAAFASAPVPDGSAVAAVGTLTPDAVTWVNGSNVPLVVSRRLGLGQVTFVAVDPAFAPLKGWDGLEGLFRNVLAAAPDRPSWAAGLRNWYSARDAVNALPGLNLPSTWQICGFLGLYIVVIGPLNYLALKRLRRRELAWVTIPGLVLIFSAATYLTGYQLRGSQASLHRLTLVQVWPDSEQARADQVVGLFSPRRSAYDLQFAEGFLVRPMPSDGSYGSAPISVALEQGERTLASGVRVDVGAVQTFVTQGQVAAPRFDSQLTFDLANTSVVLEGMVANLSDLRLTDVVLLAPGQGNVQRLGDFEPNETKSVSLSLLNSHAAQAPSNVVTPIFSFPRGVSPPSYVPSNYDSTIDDILGNSNYYSDKTQYRRYALLSAAIDTYNGGGRGGGVYLVGWTDSAPVSAEVLERTFSTLDSSVYFVNLRPKVNLGEGTLTLPPGLMNWLVLDPGQAGSPTPYGMYLYQGYDYALRFVPAQPIPFRRVQDLTLHLTSYGAGGPTGLNIYLWDFEQSTWVEQPAPDWGDTTVASPERFVGPAGEIHVRVVNPAAPQVSIEALDFTLVVER